MGVREHGVRLANQIANLDIHRAEELVRGAMDGIDNKPPVDALLALTTEALAVVPPARASAQRLGEAGAAALRWFDIRAQEFTDAFKDLNGDRNAVTFNVYRLGAKAASVPWLTVRAADNAVRQFNNDRVKDRRNEALRRWVNSFPQDRDQWTAYLVLKGLPDSDDIEQAIGALQVAAQQLGNILGSATGLSGIGPLVAQVITLIGSAATVQAYEDAVALWAEIGREVEAQVPESVGSRTPPGGQRPPNRTDPRTPAPSGDGGGIGGLLALGLLGGIIIWQPWRSR